MKRTQFAPGAFITEVPGEKFKRCKIAVHLSVPSRRDTATGYALLPHILDRRCAAIDDPLALSRRLFLLYGAELTSESFVAGPHRVVAVTLGGLKNAYALEGEDLAGEYLDLLCNLLFAPKLNGDAFETEDVEIEREKQADFLRSEMNDKRGYCIRQSRRKLFGDDPLGIESPGYLEDLPGLGPKELYRLYRELLRTAQIEVLVCGVDAGATARRLGKWLAGIDRAPQAPASLAPPPAVEKCKFYTEPMDTVQGKLCIQCTSGHRAGERGEAVMRLASALYGGLPTSRLFTNVREKQSLCYYCTSSYGYHGATLTIDSGVDHQNADRASEAILAELGKMQRAPADAEELAAGKRYLRSVFSSARDNPDTLLNWVYNEWLRDMSRSLDDMADLIDSVTADEVQQALAAFAPAVEYRITAGRQNGGNREKEGRL